MDLLDKKLQFRLFVELNTERVVHSNVEEDWGFIGEDLLFDAQDWAVHLVVNVRQIRCCGALSNTAELIVHWTVAKADPALVGAEVRHGNAA